MDLMQREGKYPLPAGASKTIMGVEFAGTVTKAGEGTEKFKEGDEVFGLAYGVSFLPPYTFLHSPPSPH
jgi:NADPH:quinone reductase-like Zn-dependent oxidoreductase